MGQVSFLRRIYPSDVDKRAEGRVETSLSLCWMGGFSNAHSSSQWIEGRSQISSTAHIISIPVVVRSELLSFAIILKCILLPFVTNSLASILMSYLHFTEYQISQSAIKLWAQPRGNQLSSFPTVDRIRCLKLLANRMHAPSAGIRGKQCVPTLFNSNMSELTSVVSVCEMAPMDHVAGAGRISRTHKTNPTTAAQCLCLLCFLELVSKALVNI